LTRDDLTDLFVFQAVAQARSFTRAAAQLGTSQAALSHTMRKLEERLGIRLLARTTRSVTPTEAGERLLQRLAPALADIEAELASIVELRDKPAGTVRINSSRHAAETILWPALDKLLVLYPDIKIEIAADQALTDIVAQGYDAGVRLGEQLAKDMVAVRIGPDLSMAVAGSADYFARHGRPETPYDLSYHDCINLRFPTLGGLYAWEFEKDGRELRVRVEGRLTFNDDRMILRAAIAGHGLAFLPDDQLRQLIENGQLERVLADWCPPFPGYHLYYPSRRQSSSAFGLVVEALRSRS
jgi:DNA-binding transcriptional LysR family regulator